MNRRIIGFGLLLIFAIVDVSRSQGIEQATESKKLKSLFASQEILPIKITYSIKDLKKRTNSNTSTKTLLKFRHDESWDSVDVKLKTRGNFRLNTCYFPPVKIKMKKSEVKESVFKGNKKLKAVFPCMNEKDKNDFVIKEYMAYKIYETMSPYNFKTRLLSVDFDEIRGKKTKNHQLKGFLIEDDKVVAKRFDGKVVSFMTHPLAQDTLTAIRNAFFQFMIGNTDFSIGFQHNSKLMFIDKAILAVPYDFDMSGFVNASYAKVPDEQGEGIQIRSVTERKYRGFKRDIALLEQVRNEFISNKDQVLELIEACEPLFEHPKNYEEAKSFILDFYAIMDDDKKFNNDIVSQARTK